MLTNKLFLGLDVGSTTVKAVVLDAGGKMLFSRYQRHFSEVRATVAFLLAEIQNNFPQYFFQAALSGSGALDLASEMNIPFVQEVVASGLCIKSRIPDADVAIELGGEDAKLTFFTGGLDQRMNETCAGGTGAFIDQMAAFLDTDPCGLDALAIRHKVIYPIASRCGVFAKTDILPLLNEGCSREDIAASIMQAVVNQTISGLARGRTIKGKVIFLGGPLAFLPSLRERFVKTLELTAGTAVFPDHGELFVALGAAFFARNLFDKEIKSAHLPPKLKDQLTAMLKALQSGPAFSKQLHLPPLFENAAARQEFFHRHAGERLSKSSIAEYRGKAWLGIDSGSTTIKAVLLDDEKQLLYSAYGPNQGQPLESAIAILKDIYAKSRPEMVISGTTVTGYGSALLLAGLRADIDEVETVAHYTGAKHFLPEVSYILDIGGQDIKCLRIRQGAIDRIQLNEACSAGCGSFIETFAKSLNMDLPEFVEAALSASSPVDLGTRCTVFINSKVKQAQKDGAVIGDIAAGLSYSVIRNAFYKVIKISDTAELGDHVIAQGGAFANDALLRALELQLGRPVVRPDIAGLMGAFGAALIAKERLTEKEDVASQHNSLAASGASPNYPVKSRLITADELKTFSASASTVRCKRCANNCLLTITTFPDKRRFVSGNRCERGANEKASDLPNLYSYKYNRLFDYYRPLEAQEAWRGTVGIPRALNIYENYPLWFTFFTRLGFRVELSSPSSKDIFFKGYGTIPSQTVCYPAKLAHGHIFDLIERKVDCIFFPCIPNEHKLFSSQNANYNCPVVIGYPELLGRNISEVAAAGIPFIHHFLPLDRDVLAKRLRHVSIFADIAQQELQKAVDAGFDALAVFRKDISDAGEKALAELADKKNFGIVLAGHPYHVDPAVHHGIADLINSCGMGVLTEDSISHLRPDPGPLRVVDQWTYHSRLYRAGAYAADQDNLAVLQLISFGCGLDAITSDQLEEILSRKGKLYAQIKVDEGDNLGPSRIRIRSLLAALRDRKGQAGPLPKQKIFQASPPFTEKMRETHTILVPQLSPIHFQFIEAIFKAEGYNVAQLPDVEKKAIELGLRHVNNDACFPAIVVVGQLLHAAKSGLYDPHKIALMISQTGGGCRATNYIAFLRKALADCDLAHIPILSFNIEGLEKNPGFSANGRLLRRVMMGGFFGDALMRMLHRTRPYEATPGSANALVATWAEKIRELLARGGAIASIRAMFAMVRDFDKLPLLTEKRKPLVGLVGEILLKYHPDANNKAAEVVEQEGGEAVVTDLMDFILYTFNDGIFRYNHLSGSFRAYLNAITGIAYLELCRLGMRIALKRSKRFTPPLRFKELKRKTKGLVSMGHQTGEGWLLTAEMVELLESGVSNILCMQPFGCLPNHITGKGLLKELKQRYPEANIAAVDYDPGASETNQINRIKLMMSVAREGWEELDASDGPRG